MSAKRRIGNAASPEVSTPNNAKKRKTNNDAPQETPESTTETGLKLMSLLKRCKDSTGRDVATEFVTLPDKKAIPEYYQATKMPLSLTMIEKKLNSHEYPDLEVLEGDVKRLIQNARDFNERGSVIADDAERLRKAMANFMPKHNPKYSDPNYKATPTPIPAHLLDDDVSVEEAPEEEEEKRPLKIKLTNKRASVSTPTVSTPTPAPSIPRPVKPVRLGSFGGKTYQSAQEQLVQEMKELKDEDGNDLALNFMDVPDPKRYADYHRKIKHPTSLNKIERKVKGFAHNRYTMITKYGSWDDFATDVRLLWNNARIYNEDGSVISELAGMLEEFFEPRFEEARTKVKDPPALDAESGIRLKLKMKNANETPDPAQKKLILTHNATSQPPSMAGSGMTIDSEALKRQQELVRTGSNGGEAKIQPTNGPRSTSITSSRPGSQQGPNGVTAQPQMNGDTTPKSNGANETSSTHAALATNGASMPPLSAGPGLPSGSPHPPASVAPQRPVQHVPTSIFDIRHRKEGKDASSALLANVSVSTHPKIKVDKRFHLDIPASSRLTQQSMTITLPSSHYYLQVKPTLSQNAIDRPSKKLVVCRGGQIIPANPPDGAVYEFRLFPGMNVIWVDIIAGPARGEPASSSTGEAADFERTTIFAMLMR